MHTVGAFFTILKCNTMSVLCRKRKCRFSAFFNSPPILSFFCPIRGYDCAAAVEYPGVIAAPVGDPTVVLGLDAAGMIGQLGITIAKVNEIQAGLSSPATRLCSHCYADACRVIDALPLHTTYELDKSFATACGDRKYFGSASGSRMSASDNEHSLSILRGAEILCIEQSVFDMVAE